MPAGAFIPESSRVSTTVLSLLLIYILQLFVTCIRISTEYYNVANRLPSRSVDSKTDSPGMTLACHRER